jgi:hypothetical protein
MKEPIKPVKKSDLQEAGKEVKKKIIPQLEDEYTSTWQSEHPGDYVNKDAAID